MKLLIALFLLAAAPAGADILIEDAYARVPSAGAPTGAAFMVIRNTGEADDRLLGAASPAAGMVQLHTHIQEAGVMKMRHVQDGFPVPAGGAHELARGGDHIMMMGLDTTLKDGMSIPLTFTFENAGEITIEVPLDNARSPNQGN